MKPAKIRIKKHTRQVDHVDVVPSHELDVGRGPVTRGVDRPSDAACRAFVEDVARRRSQRRHGCARQERRRREQSCKCERCEHGGCILLVKIPVS